MIVEPLATEPDHPPVIRIPDDRDPAFRSDVGVYKIDRTLQSRIEFRGCWCLAIIEYVLPRQKDL
jgi:hypothetical protein